MSLKKRGKYWHYEFMIDGDAQSISRAGRSRISGREVAGSDLFLKESR